MKTRERGVQGGSSPRRGDRERKAPSRYSEFLVAPQPLETLQVARQVNLGTRYTDKTPSWQHSASSNGATSHSWAPSGQDTSEGEEETSAVIDNTEGNFYPSSRSARRSRGGPRKEKLTAWLANALKQGAPRSGVSQGKSGDQRRRRRRRRRRRSVVGKDSMGVSGGTIPETKKDSSSADKKLPSTQMGDDQLRKSARNRSSKKSLQDRQSVSSEAGHSVQSWQAFKRQRSTHHQLHKARFDVEEHERTEEDMSGSEGSILIENNLLDIGGESCILNHTSASQKSLSDASMDKNGNCQLQREEKCGNFDQHENAEHGVSLLEEGPYANGVTNSPEPQDVHSYRQDEDSCHEPCSDSQPLGEDNISRMTPRTPKRAASLKRTWGSSKLSQVYSWIEEFKKQVKTVDCKEGDSGSQLVAELFRHHPELLGLSKKLHVEALNTGTHSRSSIKQGNPGQELCGHDVQGHKNLPMSSEAGYGNVDGTGLHPWLHKVASEAAAMAQGEQSTHWQGAQKRILAKILTTLPHQFGRLLKKYEREEEDRVRLTSNISYMIPSESQQSNLPNFAPLPHTAIQPPNLKEVNTATVVKALKMVKYQEVAVVILPIREDSHVKEYLLSPSKRQGIIESNSGTVMTTKKGMEHLVGNLHDRVLVCFHYNRGVGGELQPCMPHFHASESLDKDADERLGPGIHESDVQIAIIVRKGIGGTCPLRSAARSLENNGILSVLLGTVPKSTATPIKPQRTECFQLPTAVAHTRHGISAKDDTASTPYRMVGPVSKSKDPPLIPPVDIASLGEWFDSIRATARCILGSEKPQPMQTDDERGRHERHVKDVAGEPVQENPENCVMDKECPDVEKGQSAKHQLDENTNSAPEADDNVDTDLVDKSFQEDLAEDSSALQTKDLPEKAKSAPNEDPQKSFQELLDVDEAGDEVDELINEMKLCENGSAEDSVTTMVMSKLHLYTLSCRLEMFVQRDTWMDLAGDEKDHLFSIIRGVEAWLASRIKEWNSSRLKDFSECLVAAVDLDPSLSDQDLDATVKEKYSSTKKHTAKVSNTAIESACTPKKNGTSGSDDLADICNSLVDMVCPPEASDQVEECPNDAVPSVEGKAKNSEENDNLDVKEVQDRMAVDEAGEDTVEECDFSSEVVKLTASAACLGSMHNFSTSDLPWPYYFISTRDCFTYQLLPIKTKICCNGRSYVKTEYYFQPNELPDNYHQVVSVANATNVDCQDVAETADVDFQTPKRIRITLPKKEPFETPTSTLNDLCFNSSVRGANSALTRCNTGSTTSADGECTPSRKPRPATCSTDNEIPQGCFPVGVTTYTEIFSHEELNAIEAMADAVQEMAQNNDLPEECFHETIGRGGNLKRTKYFFGARYMWTREQMADPNSKRAGGVRLDVPACPKWMKALIEKPLVDTEVVPEGFINSWALNMYHDGSEGIQSHFDDAVRFLRPIYSLRLFSDSRLSFGTQLYGYTNGAFYIPMPRGCITVMEEGSYAADGVKHCVRPMDMQGKNAGLIMRQINPQAMLDAWKYHLEESTLWLKSLNLEEDATPFKERLNRLIREDISGRSMDEGMIASICRRVLYRCIREVEKGERDTTSEVRSVIEGLIRGVVRGIHQDDILLKRQIRQEQIMVKHVLDSVVRKIEHEVRSEHRLARQEQVLEAQVRSVTESMIRQLERTDAESRKRRFQATVQGERRKRTMTESLMAARSRDNKDAKRVLKTVNEIVKEVAKDQPGMLQAAQDLLQKFGMSWVRALKQKQEHCTASGTGQSQSTEVNAAIVSSQSTSCSKGGIQSSPQPIFFDFPPVVATAAPEGQGAGHDEGQGLGGNYIGNNPLAPHRSVVRLIPAYLPSQKGRLQKSESTKSNVEISTNAKVEECRASMTEDKQTNILQSNVTEKDHPVSEVKASIEEIKEENCPEKDPHVSTTVIIKPDEANTEHHTGPIPNGACAEGGRKIPKERSLVKDLMTTVLKAVIPLAVNPDKGDESADGDEKTKKLTAKDVLAAADKLLENMDMSGHNIAVTTGAAPPVILTDIVMKGPEEGKRRYNLVPGCVCYECEQQGVDPAQPPRGRSAPLPSDETLLWQCRGKCRKSFHFKCKPPPDDSARGQCSYCSIENHCCLICGEDGNGEAGKVVKCSMGVCGKFYHPQCVFSNPLTNVLQGTWIPVGSVDGDKTGMRFRCPQHYCRTCGLSGANIYSVTCIRCPYAYHSRCCPPGCKRLSKKLVLCAEHEPKGST